MSSHSQSIVSVSLLHRLVLLWVAFKEQFKNRVTPTPKSVRCVYDEPSFFSESPFDTEELLAEYQSPSMTALDLKRLVRPAQKKLLIDPQSHQPLGGDMRTRLVCLLRLLQDDVRAIQNNPLLSFDELAPSREVRHYGSVLNTLVHHHHPALVRILKSIAAAGTQEIEQFHIAIGHLGYHGGFSRKDMRFRFRHPNIPLGEIII